MARLSSLLGLVFAWFALSIAAKAIPATSHDVIIVGGGPAGLSALSALCRVSRRAVLFDTAEYRNNATRNMHDVIGADGLPPTEFRAMAREQIDKYDLATFVRAKVTSITYTDNNGFRIFKVMDQFNKPYTARRVILATGVTDVLPKTPGVMDAYGKGMYWCPWCDGFEHRDQSLAVLGPLSDALSSVLEMHNINPDTIVLTNGTDTPAQRAIATERSATWERQLAAYNVPVINNTIVRITRLRDGGAACAGPAPGPVGTKSEQQYLHADQFTADAPVIPTNENAGPNGKHYDLFRIEFSAGLSLVRAAFLINIPTKQTSTLPRQLGLKLDDSDKVVVGPKVNTSIEGIYAVGDMNNEGATNVPHAMYNGKKAGVIVHVQIAREDSLATITKRWFSSFDEISFEKLTWEQVGDELEKAWDKLKAMYKS